MNKELDDQLCQRYPKIFDDCRRTMCNDGWFDLLDVLCERLQFWTDHNRAPQVVVSQVKEKWGELSFYGQGGNQEQDGMITMAEGMSARICEHCGKPGTTLVSGEIYLTRCQEHAPSRGSVAAEQ
ncbi:hypothetical protein [Massilia arenae]|uniref:Uncharacterized protein n=1 Tax=Massilia arenae TaxID=2603288 RepID=A0A5C7FWE3_9BURK|nr:hypothetical protein [Massilia arenae]TXF99202.1 hypothetical protein FVD38_13495 [Massilia arenae]